MKCLHQQGENGIASDFANSFDNFTLEKRIRSSPKKLCKNAYRFLCSPFSQQINGPDCSFRLRMGERLQEFVGKRFFVP